MSIAHAHEVPAVEPAVDEAEVERRLRFADGALGAAGHEVTDAVLRDIRRRAARGELTAEEAIAVGFAHIDAR